MFFLKTNFVLFGNKHVDYNIKIIIEEDVIHKVP